VRSGGGHLLDRGHLHAQLDQFVLAEVRAHVREDFAFFFLDVRTDLPHQRRQLRVERGVVALQALQPFHGFLGLGVLVFGPLGLIGAHLSRHRRVHLGLLGHRVLDQFDGGLLYQVFAPLTVAITAGPAQRLQLDEHLLHLPVVRGAHVDHVAMLRHRPDLLAAGEFGEGWGHCWARAESSAMTCSKKEAMSSRPAFFASRTKLAVVVGRLQRVVLDGNQPSSPPRKAVARWVRQALDPRLMMPRRRCRRRIEAAPGYCLTG